jgi:disulfide bond formation protein DsbB
MAHDRAASDSNEEREPFPRVLRRLVLLGWIAGCFLSLYAVPHPLMHREWEELEWRELAARRALNMAPFTYFGPLLLVPLLGSLAYRRGWRPPSRDFWAGPTRRSTKLQALAVLVGSHAFLVLVIVYFQHVVGRV